jgi:hypothetical protein
VREAQCKERSLSLLSASRNAARAGRESDLSGNSPRLPGSWARVRLPGVGLESDSERESTSELFSELAGQSVPAARGLPVGTRGGRDGRSPYRWPVAAPGRLHPPVVGTCPRCVRDGPGAAACAKPARDGLGQWEEP